MVKKDDECVTVCVGEDVPDDTMRLVLDLFTSYINSHERTEPDAPIVYELERAVIHGHVMQRVTCAELPLERNLFEVENPVESTIYIYLSGKEE